ncbi:MAG: CRP/FNR family cyclic AMP-dependent transcriptional regulator [Candidatus Promineifilaceae bacterium]|jgi:CRP/FNR family cyclic AMP-dependent transcriptional regulator
MEKINTFKFVEADKHYLAGDVIFSQDEEANVMYFVKSGTVSIILQGKTIETIEEGGIFGEMALADNAPRSAAAIAQTKVSVVSIDEEDFKQHVHTTPFFALQVLKITTKRLRALMGNSGR